MRGGFVIYSALLSVILNSHNSVQGKALSVKVISSTCGVPDCNFYMTICHPRPSFCNKPTIVDYNECLEEKNFDGQTVKMRYKAGDNQTYAYTKVSDQFYIALFKNGLIYESNPLELLCQSAEESVTPNERNITATDISGKYRLTFLVSETDDPTVAETTTTPKDTSVPINGTLTTNFVTPSTANIYLTVTNISKHFPTSSSPLKPLVLVYISVGTALCSVLLVIIGCLLYRKLLRNKTGHAEKPSDKAENPSKQLASVEESKSKVRAKGVDYRNSHSNSGENSNAKAYLDKLKNDIKTVDEEVPRSDTKRNKNQCNNKDPTDDIEENVSPLDSSRNDKNHEIIKKSVADEVAATNYVVTKSDTKVTTTNKNQKLQEKTKPSMNSNDIPSPFNPRSEEEITHSNDPYEKVSTEDETDELRKPKKQKKSDVINHAECCSRKTNDEMLATASDSSETTVPSGSTSSSEQRRHPNEEVRILSNENNEMSHLKQKIERLNDQVASFKSQHARKIKKLESKIENLESRNKLYNDQIESHREQIISLEKKKKRNTVRKRLKPKKTTVVRTKKNATVRTPKQTKLLRRLLIYTLKTYKVI